MKLINITSPEAYSYWSETLKDSKDMDALEVLKPTEKRLNIIRESLLEYRRENNIFESGDKIECVDATGQRYLKLGQVYTAAGPDGSKIFVDGYRRYSFLTKRFKHITE